MIERQAGDLRRAYHSGDSMMIPRAWVGAIPIPLARSKRLCRVNGGQNILAKRTPSPNVPLLTASQLARWMGSNPGQRGGLARPRADVHGELVGLTQAIPAPDAAGISREAALAAIVVAALIGGAVGQRLSRSEKQNTGRPMLFSLSRPRPERSEEGLRALFDYAVKNPGPVVTLTVFVFGMIFAKLGDLDRRFSDLDKSIALGQQKTELSVGRLSDKVEQLVVQIGRLDLGNMRPSRPGRAPE